MMQDIIVITLVVIVTWLAISNALLRIKNDIVTAELSLKSEGDTLIKFMQNWRDEDARINDSFGRIYNSDGNPTSNDSETISQD